MPTPSIQTLTTDAQQVLNLDSISAVRSVVAVALANANTGTPLNPNLTTQQLWNEFYQVVTKPKSDIESIIANQLMKFLFAPPAPGGAGADKQVIFNDGGVLAGDADFQWDKTANLLTINGGVNITTGSANSSIKEGTGWIWTSTGTSGGTNRGGIYAINTGILNLFGGPTIASHLQIDSTGAVGINTTPYASAKVGIVGATSVNTTNYIGASTWAGQFVGSSNGAASGISLLSYSGSGLPAPVSIHAVPVADYRSGMVATFSADASGAGYFAVNQFNPTTSSTVERIRVDRDGNVDVKAGNVIVSNGKGIDFSATPSGSGTMTSELLSDYEEGTFTPSVEGTTTAGTANYIVRNAAYTKTGRVVQFQIHLAWNSGTGTGTGTRVTGLPFTANGTYVAVPSFYPIDITMAAGYVMTGSVQPGTSLINIYQIPVGGGGDGTVPYDAAGQFIITGTYMV